MGAINGHQYSTHTSQAEKKGDLRLDRATWNVQLLTYLSADLKMVLRIAEDLCVIFDCL